MADHDHYCPFLNRSDARCSKNFSLDRLNNTYDYCFGQYSACSVYLELLVERRLRRAQESIGVHTAAGSTDRTGHWTRGPLRLSDHDRVTLTRGGRPIQVA